MTTHGRTLWREDKVTRHTDRETVIVSELMTSKYRTLDDKQKGRHLTSVKGIRNVRFIEN